MIKPFLWILYLLEFYVHLIITFVNYDCCVTEWSSEGYRMVMDCGQYSRPISGSPKAHISVRLNRTNSVQFLNKDYQRVCDACMLIMFLQRFSVSACKPFTESLPKLS